MGTRTWSRRGVLTAAGRRRAGLEAIDIFGNPIPDRAPVAPPVAPPAPVPAPQNNRVLFTGTNTAAVEKSLRILQSVPLNIKAAKEEAHILDENGNVLWKNDGKATSVSIDPPSTLPLSEQDRLRSLSAHITHNHPIVRPLSDTDIFALISRGLESMQARTKPMTSEQREFFNSMLVTLRDSPNAFGGTSPELSAMARQFVDTLLANPNALSFTFTVAQPKLANKLLNAANNGMRFRSGAAAMFRDIKNMTCFLNVNLLFRKAVDGASPRMSANGEDKLIKWATDAVEMIAQQAAIAVAVAKYNQQYGTNITYGMQID